MKASEVTKKLIFSSTYDASEGGRPRKEECNQNSGIYAESKVPILQIEATFRGKFPHGSPK